MLFTPDQFVVHILGDYVIQSDYMASEKTRKNFAAALHAVTYSLCFLFLTNSLIALSIICSTHFIIDRYRLARYVCWAKNFIAPKYIETESGLVRNLPWSECSATGYPPGKPAFLVVWLMIIVDNLMHITINALALRYFG